MKDCILKSEPFRRSTKQDFNFKVLVNFVDQKSVTLEYCFETRKKFGLVILQ